MTEPTTGEMPGQSADIREMVRWPGTPTMARIKRAYDLIEQAEGRRILIVDWSTRREIKQIMTAQMDAEKLRILEWIRGFEQEATEEIVRAAREGSLKEEPELPGRIAFSATSEELVGLFIRSRNMAGAGGGMGICVSALMRDPDWIGLNAALPALKGLEIHIIEHGKKPGVAGLIVACDPGEMEDWKADKISGKTNLTIQKTIMWHGALSCNWHSNP